FRCFFFGRRQVTDGDRLVDQLVGSRGIALFFTARVAAAFTRFARLTAFGGFGADFRCRHVLTFLTLDRATFRTLATFG
ncbi:hypothetical protein Q8G50_34580, partial [Klebsiella pneumoniae]